MNILRSITLALFLLWPFCALASNPVVNLDIAYKTVNYTGKTTKAIAINGEVPGPTLHFKEGDHVTINVTNHLNEGTSVHWHGLIVPWQMDGVSGVSQNPIPPGGTFHYKFTLLQSGTYWYHAHAGLQEQRGLYGTIIIDPPKPPPYHYNKDFVIFLADWINTDPSKVYSNLKKQGGYYATEFPLQPSLQRFLNDYLHGNICQRRQLVDTYWMMQKMRMSPYDISDVRYDALLLNGQTTKTPWQRQVKIGDVVRLRIIAGGGSTFFQFKVPNTPMTVVHVEGNDVKPYVTNELLLGPAETYDVLIKITKDTTILYTESADTALHVYGAFVTKKGQKVDYQDVKPFPIPQPTMTMGHDMANMPGMGGMGGMSNMDHSNTKMNNMSGMAHSNNMNAMPGMNMKGMNNMSNMDNMPGMNMSPNAPTTKITAMLKTMPMPPAKNDDSSYKTTGTKYQDLVSYNRTNDPNKPFIVEKMVLSGYMERYMWFINGVPEYRAKPIIFKQGQRYRFIFINNTMMHHPMHMHGHWFILRNGHGAYDPLLHTIDVPPGGVAVVDIDADAEGQWYFHCHNLYHMMAGMGNVVHYEPSKATNKSTAKTPHFVNVPTPLLDPTYNPDTALHYTGGMHGAMIDAANNLSIDTNFYSAATLTYKGLFGTDYNKLELFTNEAEYSDHKIQTADMDIFYWHLISEFWAIKGGLNAVYRPAERAYVQPGIGLEGTMPFFIDTDARGYFHDGSAKLDLEFARNTQLMDRLFLYTSIRGIAATKTVQKDDVGSGLDETEFVIGPGWQWTPYLETYIQFESTNYYGQTKTVRQNDGYDIHDNIFKVGVSLLF